MSSPHSHPGLTSRVMENLRDVRQTFVAAARCARQLAARVVKQNRFDLILGLILLAVAVGVCTWSMTELGNRLDPPSMEDKWFQADVGSMRLLMTDPYADQYKTEQHPVSSLLLWSAVKANKAIFGLSNGGAVLATIMAEVGLTAFVFFFLLRCMGSCRLDASIFTALLISSSGWIFFSPILEFYVLNCLSISAALLLLANPKRFPDSQAGMITAAVAISLSVTATNVVVGIAGAWRALRLSKAVQVCANGFLIILAIWFLQHLLLPSSRFFLEGRLGSDYVFAPDLARIVKSWRAIFAHSMVMPGIGVTDFTDSFGTRTYLSVQNGSMRRTGLLGMASLAIWGVLLLRGLTIAVRSRLNETATFAMLSFLVVQVALFTVYGEETFLYSLQFLPMLIVIASFGTSGKYRLAFRAGAIALVIMAFAGNVAQFSEAVEMLDGITTTPDSPG